MAKPTTHIEKQVQTQVQQDAQALGDLLTAVAQHKEPLLKFLDILGEMDQAGLLEAARGMMKARKKIGVIGVTQMNKSGAQRAIKNSITMMQFLGKLDPAKTSQMLDAVARGVESAQPSERRLGMLGMMGTLRDPEVNASLSMMMNFLRGMGEGLPHVH